MIQRYLSRFCSTSNQHEQIMGRSLGLILSCSRAVPVRVYPSSAPWISAKEHRLRLPAFFTNLNRHGSTRPRNTIAPFATPPRGSGFIVPVRAETTSTSTSPPTPVPCATRPCELVQDQDGATYVPDLEPICGAYHRRPLRTSCLHSPARQVLFTMFSANRRWNSRAMALKAGRRAWSRESDEVVYSKGGCPMLPG